MKADLHIHSRHSNDGELPVHEIIQRCRLQQVDTFSITDHNSVQAHREAVPACREAGPGFIPGIEIDCQHRGIDLHLLGYQIQWQSPDFSELEEMMDKKIMDAFPEMVRKLDRAGIRVDMYEVLEKAGGDLPSGELIAEVLLTNKAYHPHPLLLPYMEGGARSDMPYINFYHDFFAQGKPAYVKIEHMPFEEAVELVKKNAGIPIVAHPGLNLKGREEVVLELIEQGAEGWEVFNNYHTPAQIRYLAETAMKERVLITCGSDFHGKTKPLIEVGHYRFDPSFEAYLSECIARIA